MCTFLTLEDAYYSSVDLALDQLDDVTRLIATGGVASRVAVGGPLGCLPYLSEADEADFIIAKKTGFFALL